MDATHVDRTIQQPERRVLNALPSHLDDLVQRTSGRNLVGYRGQMLLYRGLHVRSRQA